MRRATRNGVVFGALLLCVFGAWVIFGGVGPGAPPVKSQRENVLIIVADDLGVDVLECYGEGSSFPPTPTIDMLVDTGVLFRNAWSNPMCSTTRATIQTGRHSFRTGVGSIVLPGGTNSLQFSETIIPEVLDLNPLLGYSHAAIGKWHLTGRLEGGVDGPNLSGYAHFSGTLRNLTRHSYFDWPKTENGEMAKVQEYATTDNVNEAIEWINDRGQSPWFMWLAFNAPHSPWHVPPDELHSYDLSGKRTSLELFQATVEAMDSELARLFASIPQDVFENTNVIFLGDNGTSSGAVQPPFNPRRAKGTLYEGGINVPLIISGPQVASPGSESGILVHTTDLFATALEMMGVDVEASVPPRTVIDSRSVLPVLQERAFDPRLFVYAELFGNRSCYHHGQTIRNTQGFKLIRFTTHPAEFYNLTLDPFEIANLLLGELDRVQQANFNELISKIEGLTGEI